MVMQDNKTLINKRILFFHLPNYGYHKIMIDAFERAGATVDSFDCRPSNSFLTKALIRINKKLLAPIINKYYENILQSIKGNQYDIVYVYKGEGMPSKVVEIIKTMNPNAFLVLYFPDSIRNNPNAKDLIPLFDSCYTFDKKDSEDHNLQFLPLFYSKQFETIANNSSKYQYDLMFVGTVHSDRYKFVKRIISQFEENGAKAFTWFYFPSKLLYYKMCAEDVFVRSAPKTDFKFTTLNMTQLTSILAQSKIVIDIQHPKQTGLTMRTIETFGAKRKMITTNSDITDYDFYNANNILVVDRTNPIIPASFINSPYEDIPNDIYEKYGIDSWINILVSGHINKA